MTEFVVDRNRKRHELVVLLTGRSSLVFGVLIRCLSFGRRRRISDIAHVNHFRVLNWLSFLAADSEFLAGYSSNKSSPSLV